MWNLLFCPVCPNIQKGIALFERLQGVSTLPSEKDSITIMIMSM
jgi:hypothetical protein